jgi:hypothetical protein
MSEVVTEFNPEEYRAKWLKRLVAELNKIEPLMPIKFLPDGVEYPQWVLNVEREFSVVMLPAAKLRDADDKMTPKRMGAVLGHMCAMAVWMMEWLNVQEENHKENEQITVTEDDLERVQKFCGSLGDWYNAARRLAKLALCSSVDQTYQDMTDFLLGYADGFSRKPKTFQAANFGSTTFEIYHCMLVYWRVIEPMESVRQFHEWLVIIFGASKIGEQKRVEKICQRMGLRFCKPGHPKKK